MMTSSIDISDMRKPYNSERETFKEDDLVASEPFANFKNWFDTACKTEGILEANAMAVATATKDGRPSVRMILLKGFGVDGFKFFTSYESRKAQELTENPHASLMFYWEPLKRSVRIEGRVERVSEDELTEYFQQRPKPSQIGASVSKQSSVIPSREVLTEHQRALEEKFKDADTLPKPKNWGGYRVLPERFEFWQGQSNRVHDRLVFLRRPGTEYSDTEGSWELQRLAP